jgi:predicted N-acetyltransferase YhbS
MIGALVRGLLTTTPPGALRVFTAVDDGRIVSGALFSRLTYPDDPRRVFVMAPVAVATDRQGEGIGQGLIRHALDSLKDAGVDVVTVYGDPAFYGRTGFAPITEAEAAAPHPLGHPEGWQALALAGGPMAPLKGPSRCVAALDDPALW